MMSSVSAADGFVEAVSNGALVVDYPLGKPCTLYVEVYVYVYVYMYVCIWMWMCMWTHMGVYRC